MLSIAPPQFYHAQAGQSKAEWSVWKQEFKNYVVASGIDSLQDARKKAILFHYMGKALKLHVGCVRMQTRMTRCLLNWRIIIGIKLKLQ